MSAFGYDHTQTLDYPQGDEGGRERAVHRAARIAGALNPDGWRANEARSAVGGGSGAAYRRLWDHVSR